MVFSLKADIKSITISGTHFVKSVFITLKPDTMIDLKKQFQEAKEKAKELMKAGKIKDYIKQLEVISQLQLGIYQ